MTLRALGVKARPKRRIPVAVRRLLRPVETPYVEPIVRAPFVDVLVEDDRVLVLAHLPGVDERDIMVYISSWDVTISAERGNVRFYRRVLLPVLVMNTLTVSPAEKVYSPMEIQVPLPSF